MPRQELVQARGRVRRMCARGRVLRGVRRPRLPRPLPRLRRPGRLRRARQGALGVQRLPQEPLRLQPRQPLRLRDLGALQRRGRREPVHHIPMDRGRLRRPDQRRARAQGWVQAAQEGRGPQADLPFQEAEPRRVREAAGRAQGRPHRVRQRGRAQRGPEGRADAVRPADPLPSSSARSSPRTTAAA